MARANGVKRSDARAGLASGVLGRDPQTGTSFGGRSVAASSRAERAGEGSRDGPKESIQSPSHHGDIMNDEEYEERSALDRIVGAHPRLFRGENPALWSWVPVGWQAIVDRLCGDLENLLGDNVGKMRVDQIKEKFAGLRFYYSIDLPEPAGDPPPARIVDHAGGVRISGRSNHPLKQAIDALIEGAEAEAGRTCQWCGSTDGVTVVYGGKVQKPRNPNRNSAGPGLAHSACAQCRGNALTPSEWHEEMEQHRQRTARRHGEPNGEGREGGEA